MKISIFGLGYVGTVSAACIANDGHNVIGVDVNSVKVALINACKSPIIEKDIQSLVKKGGQNGKLRATTNTSDGIDNSDISFVCVGTPSQLNGNLDLKYIWRVSEEIGQALKHKKAHHTIVLRSTVLPGTMRDVVIPALEKNSGKKNGHGFTALYHPEFMREGSAVNDFYHPPKTVIGEIGKGDGDVLGRLYEKITAPLIRTNLETAEMIKYADNIWHALKIGYANEIGNVCKVMGIDGFQFMKLFCEDTKLNISNAYLKPGFAFGGSCLPKDLRALTYKARNLDLSLPIINGILPSNQLQIEKGIHMVMAAGVKKIGVLGISFKGGTDDLRESPVVELVEYLLGKGYDVKIYDRNVKIASIIGSNRDYIINRIPHIFKLMVNRMDELLAHAETIVIGNNDSEFNTIMQQKKDKQNIIDFVHICEEFESERTYEGICW